jgi:spore coat polysaccharide biosynthesis predicted glycosyltransferase SpsG
MIWLRCRLGQDIGWGHAMRCLALAQAIDAEGVAAGFILDATAGDFADRVAAAGFPVQRIDPGDPLAEEAADYPDCPVVLDLSNGLCQPGLPALVAALKAQGRKIALIEGLAPHDYAGDVAPDLLVTPYLGAPPGAGNAPRLTGAEYAVLGPEYAAEPTPLADRDKILVALSGSDPWQLTEKVLAALSSFGPRLSVVIGGGMPADRASALRRAIEEMAGTAHDAPASLQPLFGSARAAVIGPGLVKYEAVATRTPAVIVSPGKTFDPPQEAFVAAGLASLVRADQPGCADDLSAALTRALNHIPASPPPIDGQGARRLAKALHAQLGE